MDIFSHKRMCTQMGISNYTVKVVLIWGDKIIVLKKDKRHIELVGGMNMPEDNQDIYRTAVRKVEAETGIVINADQLEFLTMDSWENHTFYCLRADIDDDVTRTIRQSPCENGSVPKAYDLGKILSIPPKLPELHQRILRRHLTAA